MTREEYELESMQLDNEMAFERRRHDDAMKAFVRRRIELARIEKIIYGQEEFNFQGGQNEEDPSGDRGHSASGGV